MRWDLELSERECFAWGFYTKPHMAPAGAPNTPLVLMAAISRKVHYCSFQIIVPFVFTTILTLLGHFGGPSEFCKFKFKFKAGAVAFFLLHLGLLYWAVWYGKLSLRRRQHWDPPESLQKVLANSTA